ncbi:hypothetical protein, partial [Pseudomonas sp. IPO3747]|uniref:hypothetical protein n=1 Tax=Pseudomonas sp. IPO3747 TaxID=2738829 RepID=UPI001C435929
TKTNHATKSQNVPQNAPNDTRTSSLKRLISSLPIASGGLGIGSDFDRDLATDSLHYRLLAGLGQW